MNVDKTLRKLEKIIKNKKGKYSTEDALTATMSYLETQFQQQQKKNAANAQETYDNTEHPSAEDMEAMEKSYYASLKEASSEEECDECLTIPDMIDNYMAHAVYNTSTLTEAEVHVMLGLSQIRQQYLS